MKRGGGVGEGTARVVKWEGWNARVQEVLSKVVSRYGVCGGGRGEAAGSVPG